MEIRNVKLVSDTEAIMEYNHPNLGWVPYTAVKDSGEPEMELIFKEALKKKPDYDISYLKNRIINEVQSKTNPDVTKYSDAEISSFNLKRMEAEKVMRGEKSNLIETEALISKTTPIELARKIIEKNNKSTIFETQKRLDVEKVENDVSKIKTYEKLVSYIGENNNGTTNKSF